MRRPGELTVRRLALVLVSLLAGLMLADCHGIRSVTFGPSTSPSGTARQILGPATTTTTASSSRPPAPATVRVTVHPKPTPRSTPRTTPKPSLRPSPRPVWFPSCAAARAAGAAPILRGQPGYRLGLDRDRDGIACE